MKWALALSTAKRWLLPLAISLVVVGLGGSWWHGYTTGKTAERAAHQSALEAERAKQARLVDELEQAQMAQRIVYRDRVRVVEREADPSGCADVGVPDRVRDALGWRRD